MKLVKYDYEEDRSAPIEHARTSDARVIYQYRSNIVGRGLLCEYDGKVFKEVGYTGQLFTGVLAADIPEWSRVTLPTVPLSDVHLPYYEHRSGFRIERYYSAKVELDRAFPAGNYQFVSRINGRCFQVIIPSIVEFEPNPVQITGVDLAFRTIHWSKFDGGSSDWIRVLVGRPDGVSVFKTPSFREPGYLTAKVEKVTLPVLPPGKYIATAVFYRNAHMDMTNDSFAASGSYKRFKFCLEV